MKKIVVVGLLAMLGGCGSSGGGSGSGGAGGTQAGGHGGGGGTSACGSLTPFTTGSTGTISWKDNGVLVCPLLAIVQRTTSGVVDTFELDSSSASSYAVDIALSSYNGLLNGAYTCQDGNGTTAPYVYLGFISPSGSGMAAPGACTVDITFAVDGAGVEHARGTFSGTGTGTAGNETITDGVFDVTVTQSGSGNGGAGGHPTGAGGAGG